MRLPLAILVLACLTPQCSAQTPAEDYASAHKRFLSHVPPYNFLHDDTPAAIADAQAMWNAVATFVFDLRHTNPTLSPAAISHALCLLTTEPEPREAIQQSPEQQCEQATSDVIALTPTVLLIAASSGEIGTVFAIDASNPQATILWSITNVSVPSATDPHDLIGAWQPAKAGGRCREKEPPNTWATCGPLYASLIMLPPDTAGHPRFAIDAGYAQSAGATIGKQTSVWLWDDKPMLLWDDSYSFMIDQGGSVFDQVTSTLTIIEKGYFRSFFDCGSCATRPLEHRIQITKSGIEDLGTRSLVPELDAIDELFWRLAHNESTTQFATPQVSKLLKPQLAQARKVSDKIDPTFFTTGMIDDTLVSTSNAGAEVCFIVDEDIGRLDFTLRKTADGGYFFTHVTQPAGSFEECTQPAFMPPHP